MIRTVTFCIGVAFWAAPSFADQCAGKTQVLHCNIIADKVLTVCIGDGVASYAYGPSGAPELAMTHPLGEVTGTPWAGVGRAIWEEIIFYNNDVSYAVWISLDRLAKDDPTDGGVVVRRGGQVLAEQQCQEGTAQVTTFAIPDGFQQADFCWDFDTQQFHRDCTN